MFLHQLKSRSFASVPVILSASALNTIAFNQQAIQYAATHATHTHYDFIFLPISIALIITAIFIITILPFYLLNIDKLALFIFLYFSAATAYFSNKFGIVYDSTVVKSFFTTNYDEFSQYWNIKLALFLFTLSGLTIYMFSIIELKKENFIKRAWNGVKLLLLCLITIFTATIIQYKSISSFLRNHRHVRQMVVPLSPFYEFAKIVGSIGTSNNNSLLSIGTDAKKMNSQKQIFVLVVGETARGDHFSINGYNQNNTNPLLSKRNVITYKNVTSCGTATAISLPCMFSNIGRVKFSEEKAKNTENLLDIAQKANYETIWIDNNTGCKGVCSRLKNVVDITEFKNSKICTGSSCFDEILIEAFEKYLNAEKNQFFVLHMLGSHGPSYFLRYPKEFEKFQPSCKTSDLSSCSKEAIINTYDNTIVYTDFVIDQLIQSLDSISKNTNIKTSLLYVSDHGESLGENGIYLHSLPYFIAPDEQKNAAVIYWESGNAIKNLKLKTESVSHDYIFSSVLNKLSIKTKIYNQNLDLFRLDNQYQK